SAEVCAPAGWDVVTPTRSSRPTTATPMNNHPHIRGGTGRRRRQSLGRSPLAALREGASTMSEFNVDSWISHASIARIGAIGGQSVQQRSRRGLMLAAEE